MNSTFSLPADHASILAPYHTSRAPTAARARKSKGATIVDEAGLRTGSIMIVDDDDVGAALVRKFLKEAGYSNVTCWHKSSTALTRIKEAPPSVVILDYQMPGMDGLEVLREMRAVPSSQHVPVIMLTVNEDQAVRRAAMESGATDFLNKPVETSDLMPRLRTALIVGAHNEHLTRYSERLERDVQLRTAELDASQREVIHCLARAAEFRDDDTGQHVIRVGRFAGLIASTLGYRVEGVRLLEQAAQLHDIGKIGVPDAILHKPTKLEPWEFEVMKQHCEIGARIIRPPLEEAATAEIPDISLDLRPKDISDCPVIAMAATIALTHHERWDGSGYPSGLGATEIPIESRITAVADVFDALGNRRAYKKAFLESECLEHIRSGRGAAFDPDVVDAFLDEIEEVRRIQRLFPSPEVEPVYELY